MYKVAIFRKNGEYEFLRAATGGGRRIPVEWSVVLECETEEEIKQFLRKSKVYCLSEDGTELVEVSPYHNKIIICSEFDPRKAL